MKRIEDDSRFWLEQGGTVVFCFFFFNRFRKRQTYLYTVEQKENGREDYHYFDHFDYVGLKILVICHGIQNVLSNTITSTLSTTVPS